MEVKYCTWEAYGFGLPLLLGVGASTSTAIDELSMLLNYMRVWELDKLVTIDALMPPTADYFDGIYFQVGQSPSVV